MDVDEIRQSISRDSEVDVPVVNEELLAEVNSLMPWWYRPTFTTENAIDFIGFRQAGAFVVRDNVDYKHRDMHCYELVVKVCINY